jgi:RNA ligase
MTFVPFPKMARLVRACFISEKIDGTNAQVFIIDPENTDGETWEWCLQTAPVAKVGELFVYAGSRSRWITPGKLTDNFGFAAWVYENATDLVKALGEGRHYGEWYGKGIQRGYGLDEKRFALFNARSAALEASAAIVAVPQLYTVPCLYEGPFSTAAVDEAMAMLYAHGSYAAPGFMKPEGVVVYHKAAGIGFKQTYDDNHKEAA